MVDTEGACFDLILCKQSEGGYNPISKTALMALPMSERIALIQGRRLKFFRGDTEVPVFEALKSLNPD